MAEGKYADYVEAILKECPDADAGEVADAFAKYEEEFYIPPQDAMRSVLRRFKSGISPGPSTTERAPRQTKKVASLTELTGSDKDVEIEVAVITHNIRDQMIRGEEKQVAFGMLEDNPWEENGQRIRWDYKDWGPHANLAAGSIIRIEGASVNEYNGKMSLNINQSTRIVVLKEGVATLPPSNDPLDIADANGAGCAGQVCREQFGHAVLDLLDNLFCAFRPDEGFAQGVQVVTQRLEGGQFHLENEIA